MAISDGFYIKNCEIGIGANKKFEIMDNSQFHNNLDNFMEKEDSYNVFKGKADPAYFRNKVTRMVHDLSVLKDEYKDDVKVKELVETSLTTIQDLKDELYGRYAKVSYDETKRSLNISLNEIANNNLKKLILNKTDELTEDDINRIEDYIEERVIKFLEDKE